MPAPGEAPSRPPDRVAAAGSRRLPRLAGAALATVAFAALAVCTTWPLLRQLPDHVVVGARGGTVADALASIWTLAWTARALSSEPLHVLDGKVFHPSPHVVARSERLLGDQPVFAPVWLATGNPVLAFNCVVLASVLLSGLLMYLLVRRWTGSAAGAVVAGLAFAAAPCRSLDPAHADGLQVQYLPLVLLLLDRALVTGRTGPAAVAAAAVGLVVLCSRSTGAMALAIVGAYAIAHLAVRGVRGERPSWRAMAMALSPLAVVVPLLLVLGGLAALVPPRGFSPGGPLAGAGRGTLVVAAAGVFSLAARGPDRRDDAERAVRILSLVLATATAIVGARGAARLAGGLASFGLSALAGLGASSLLGWTRPRSLVRGVALGVAIVAVLTPVAAGPARRAEAVPAPANVPPVYRWLAENGEGGTLLELGLGGAWAMYFSTYHWLPLLNGHGDGPPPEAAFLARYVEQLPSAEGLRVLVDCAGLRWVVLHDIPAARRTVWGGTAGVRLRAGFPHDHAIPDVLFEVLLTPRLGCRARLRSERSTLARPRPVRSEDLRGSLVIESLPDVLPAEGESRVNVTIVNEGEVILPGLTADGTRRVALGVEWLDVAGRRRVASEEILLPADVLPGRPLRFTAWLRHPPRPGDYVLSARVRRRWAGAGGLKWEQNVTVSPATPAQPRSPNAASAAARPSRQR